ncbi:MAG: metallophosphoesterase [Bacteroidetes bacterium]|nr:metallophosphoesterase [Bacteroidota bacterium]
MKKKAVLITCLILLHFPLFAQDTISQRIVLIGDAGQLTNGKHPVVDAVRNMIPLDNKTTILFLGDNLYKHGLPDDQNKEYYNQAKAVLDSQLSVADNTPAKVYMIPGNHDWENGSRNGFDAIVRQQLYVDFLGKPNVKYYPEDGCPGPVELILGKDSSVAVILFDSQWWIHAYDKPEIESDCSCKTKDELVTQIGDLLARNSKRLVLIACHHPFESNGMHGGYYTLKQHIFPFTDIKKSMYIPLPVLGSIYPIARSVFGTPQDLKHPNYANMVEQITEVVKASSPNVIFVSGHDHNLQYIKKNGYNYIVSGGGCKQNRTSKNRASMYNSTATGFSVMEISKNKNVTVTFYTVSDTAVHKDYSSTMMNFSTLAEAPVAAKEESVPVFKDTVNRAARKDYKPIGGLKKFFMGQNYRPEWSTQVNMKVLHLRTEKGGLKIKSLGGGKQTRTLQLTDKHGKEWILRSSIKNTANIIPDVYRSEMAKNLVTELSSASHPYASLVIPELANVLHIAVPHPELFFVPDDPALGIYRPLFANTVCMLEEKEPSFDGSNTKTTAKTFNKMLEENDHRPDQPAVLRARLLDMVLGDFDRHFDQWKWGSTDTGKGKIYYPIPRDRDQALFYSDGFLLRAISGRAMPFLKGFRYQIPKVNWLGYTARDFDRFFMAELSKDQWKETISAVQEKLSDTVIRFALKKMPVEIQSLRNEKIAAKLISRRNLLTSEGMKYYNFISRKVNVVGSNLKEYFKVSKQENGQLQVRVYARNKGNDTSFIMYNRIFDPAVTKEIRLFGLHDNDVFEIDEDAVSRIKIRIIGGKGSDTFDIRGRTEAILYDQKDGGNVIRHSNHAKNRFSLFEPGNDKTIVGFNYNTTRLPQLIMGYNSDDGMIVGAGIARRTFGFRNLPYASDQKLGVLYAPGSNAWQLNYKGEFNHITRGYDLLVNMNYASPSLHNFFGLGNNSVALEGKEEKFYQTRYKTFEAEVLARKRVFDKLHFMIGPSYFQYSASRADNLNNILTDRNLSGLNQERIFSQKKYLGAKVLMRLDNRNNEFFPTRGMLWNNQLVSMAGIGSGSNNITSISSDMTVYASLSDPAKVVAVLKFGGGKLLNKNYEFFQAMNFGANNGLPAFRKNRYAGRASLYSGIEMKFKLFDLNSFMLPGTVGISGFYNTGRVWQPGDNRGSWHGAYGCSLYINPLNLFTISGSAGFMDKERFYNITIGTKMNLTF